ncbi:ABC transporter ATP-binding protein [Leucobacter weissii]|uniref:ABC transporter ATP-binding protein n=1 Tax=Leucobacter weissii TaxID=1983706 RepID=A0A939MIL2_9MICO|nr:ABC transporter ATP-binding protein [Leucobacter weissii]MBO1900920.1 ABC transporter ATP-binding protein [Leucobacter weissii]
MSAAPILRCAKLTKRFGGFTAVRDLDLELEPGAVLGFLGPNGAGKSTAIRMMLGLSAPSAGTVRLFGEDPLRQRRVRARVGYSPGELRLDDRLTVAATLRSWARLRGGVDEAFRDRLVARLGVQVDRHVRGLSTGNRRKLALVGALMSRPELLILDEPTNGLDPLVQNEFMAILEEVTASGTSVLLSSHVLSEVEQIANRVVVIRAGVAVADGPTDELRHGAAQEFRVVFAGAGPDAADIAAFAALPGAVSVESSRSGGARSGELRIRWSGPPGPLLRRLAGTEIVSLTAPEPDLETAFLSYYRGGGDGGAGGASAASAGADSTDGGAR